jgi:putative pyruvate formate lyase activating enzyme
MIPRSVIEYFDSNLEACLLCPRRCGVNRLKGETGYCKAGPEVRVSSITVHTGEEPPISGTAGSGTVFFSNCNMACVYCQNYPISQLGHGNPITPDDLASAMLRLQSRGAHNINLVTPTQHLPGTVRAIAEARQRGLKIPIVYNTSGYESAETIDMLADIVQIYLADMRYSDAAMAARYSDAPDYPEQNRLAVRHMFATAGLLECAAGIGRRGLIIRHLVLPGGIAGTERTFEFIAGEISPLVHISLMCQYFPANKAPGLPTLSRRITPAEYRKAVALLRRYGLENGWIQDLAPGNSPVA